MEHERKASSVMSNPLNKIIYFFDKSYISEQIIDHYTNALEEYIIDKNYPKIIEMRKRLVSLHQGIDNSASKYFIASYSLELGDDYLKANDVQEAEKYYNKAINANKDDYDKLCRTYEHIANSYYDTKEYNTAYTFYEKYIDLEDNPKSSTLINFAVCCIKKGKYSKASTLMSEKLTICNSKYLSQQSNITEIRNKYVYEKYYLQSVACSLLISTSTARTKLNNFIQSYKITNDQKIETIKLIINNYEVFKFSNCIKNLKILLMPDDITRSIIECLDKKRLAYSANKVPKTLGDKLISKHSKGSSNDYESDYDSDIISDSFKSKIHMQKTNLLKNAKLPNGPTKPVTQGDSLIKAFYSDSGDIDLC